MGAALAYKYDYYEDASKEKVSDRIETKVLILRPYRIPFGGNSFEFKAVLSARTPEIKKLVGCQFATEVSQISWKNVIKTRINRIVHFQKFEEWGETKPSGKTLSHAYKLVDLCYNDMVLEYADVTTGGNGTIMFTWTRPEVLATLDVGENTFTYSVISRGNYQRLGGGKYEATRDAEVDELYRLLK